MLKIVKENIGQKAVFKALLKGKKIKDDSWDDTEFIQLNEEGLVDENGGQNFTFKIHSENIYHIVEFITHDEAVEKETEEKKKEIIQWLLDDKKIGSTEWFDNAFIYFDKEKLRVIDETGNKFEIDHLFKNNDVVTMYVKE